MSVVAEEGLDLPNFERPGAKPLQNEPVYAQNIVTVTTPNRAVNSPT